MGSDSCSSVNARIHALNELVLDFSGPEAPLVLKQLACAAANIDVSTFLSSLETMK